MPLLGLLQHGLLRPAPQTASRSATTSATNIIGHVHGIQVKMQGEGTIPVLVTDCNTYLAKGLASQPNLRVFTLENAFFYNPDLPELLSSWLLHYKKAAELIIQHTGSDGIFISASTLPSGYVANRLSMNNMILGVAFTNMQATTSADWYRHGGTLQDWEPHSVKTPAPKLVTTNKLPYQNMAEWMAKIVENQKAERHTPSMSTSYRIMNH